MMAESASEPRAAVYGGARDGSQAVAAPPQRPVLRVRNATKSYPGIQALRGVDLELWPGRVHALVGENGAGKSTLLKILCGAQTLTEGQIEFDGSEVTLGNPHAARRMGIVAVHQELMILPALSALANVFLGQELHNGPVLDMRAMRDRFEELSRQLSVQIDPRAMSRTLSTADQQALEIMRGLQANARVLVLDEPTSSLAVHEREALFDNMRVLRSQGVALLLISHDLDEVLAISDDVTVLRDGQLIRTAPVAEWSKQSLVGAMLGASAQRAESAGRRTGTVGSDIALAAEHLTVPGRIRDAQIEVRRGEIVGIAGLVGAGRTEMLRALAGLEPGSSGELHINGRRVRWPHTPRRAQRYGIALVPEDRKGQGLVLGLPAFANVTLSSPWASASGPFLFPSAERRTAQQVTAGVGFADRRLDATTRTLSGGNQQKLVLAKWMARRMPILLVDEPTRGIDIGAKAEIFRTLHGLADEGAAIVVVSSEMEEVMEHSDRIVVIAGGVVLDTLDAAAATQQEILERIFAVEQ